MSKSITLVVSSIVFLVIVAASSFLYAWTGKVVGITDGDTIKVLHDHQEVKIRLHGVDTPEKKQAYGNAAKKATAKLTAGKIVKVEQTDTDRYHRTVAIITVAGVNVNQALVQSGYAWVYPKYCKQEFCRDWLKLEEQAKKARIGLWKDSNPEPPWIWRKTSKLRVNSSSIISGNFHGNSSSHVFHASGCQHFNCKNCTVGFMSAEEAGRAGYRPDNRCVK